MLLGSTSIIQPQTKCFVFRLFEVLKLVFFSSLNLGHFLGYKYQFRMKSQRVILQKCQNKTFWDFVKCLFFPSFWKCSKEMLQCFWKFPSLLQSFAAKTIWQIWGIISNSSSHPVGLETSIFLANLLFSRIISWSNLDQSQLQGPSWEQRSNEG